MPAWTLSVDSADPTAASYVFEISPNKAELPTATAQVSVVETRPYSALSTKRQMPFRASVSGVLRTQEQYQALNDWSSTGTRVDLVDHLGRKYKVRLEQFTPSIQAPMRFSAPWRHTYTLTLYIYSGPDAT